MTKADEVAELARALRRTYPTGYESGYDTWLRTFTEIQRLMVMLHPRTDGVYNFKNLVDPEQELFEGPVWGPSKLKRPRMLIEDVRETVPPIVRT